MPKGQRKDIQKEKGGERILKESNIRVWKSCAGNFELPPDAYEPTGGSRSLCRCIAWSEEGSGL